MAPRCERGLELLRIDGAAAVQVDFVKELVDIVDAVVLAAG